MRAILHRNQITFQHTTTWKESNDPDAEPKLQKIEDVLEHHFEQAFAFDEFGPLSIGDDTLWGVNREHKGTTNTLKALRSVRAARPGGKKIYIIMDNLSAHTGQRIRHWADNHQMESCVTPAYSSWADPIEAHFGPCASSPSPTIPTTLSNPANSRPTYGGATPTPVLRMPWTTNAANEPGSAAKKGIDGDGMT